jgi:hypothetical protein
LVLTGTNVDQLIGAVNAPVDHVYVDVVVGLAGGVDVGVQI